MLRHAGFNERTSITQAASNPDFSSSSSSHSAALQMEDMVVRLAQLSVASTPQCHGEERWTTSQRRVLRRRFDMKNGLVGANNI